MQRPGKPEGQPYTRHLDTPMQFANRIFRRCWWHYLLGVLRDGNWRGPRGMAYEVHGQVAYCYLRVVNTHGKFIFQHMHDHYTDAHVDPFTGAKHSHTIDGSRDVWTGKVEDGPCFEGCEWPRPTVQ